MESKEFITLILPSMLNGVLSAIITALLAGIIVWLIQKKYEKSSNEHAIYQERIRKEEDEFYSNIYKAKIGFYKFILNLTNPNPNDKVIQQFVDMLSNASMLSKCNQVVLGKYSDKIENILDLYGQFRQLHNTIGNNPTENTLKNQSKMKDLSNKIMSEFYSIDTLYYYYDIRHKKAIENYVNLFS